MKKKHNIPILVLIVFFYRSDGRYGWSFFEK